ncbi:hypothetical protein GOODEAATRI_027080 [Goodea atripinnis]|uniref:Uncharacterized protein n=1 Tax=Goodea atripinnis TaxID=208336 RepID=A0ABV0MVH1_9TELE
MHCQSWHYIIAGWHYSFNADSKNATFFCYLSILEKPTPLEPDYSARNVHVKAFILTCHPSHKNNPQHPSLQVVCPFRAGLLWLCGADCLLRFPDYSISAVSLHRDFLIVVGLLG